MRRRKKKEKEKRKKAAKKKKKFGKETAGVGGVDCRTVPHVSYRDGHLRELEISIPVRRRKVKMSEFPEVQGGGSLIVAWQVKNKHVLVVGGGEVSSMIYPRRNIYWLYHFRECVHDTDSSIGCCWAYSTLTQC